MKNATLGRASDVFSNDVYSFNSKSCANCDFDFSNSDFVAVDGSVIFCLTCYMVENKVIVREFAKVLKVALGCESCGFSKSAHALQYDHKDPSTKKRHAKTGKPIHPSDFFRYCSLSDFILEIQKCVILCANCHAIKTAKERGLI